MHAHKNMLKSVRSKYLNSCHRNLLLHECGLTSKGRKTLVLATDVLESVSNAKKKKKEQDQQ